MMDEDYIINNIVLDGSDGGTGVRESSQIIVNDISLAFDGDYVTFSTKEHDYYIWFTIDTIGSDPSPGGNAVGPINIETGVDDASTVANKIGTALNALVAELTPGVDGAAVFWTNVTPGSVTDISAVLNDSGFLSVSVITQGVG